MLRWYIMQTYTGQEEKLVEMVRRVVPREFYDDCFVIYHEQLWKRHQENQIHIRRVFPGYVFITSGDPEGLFLCLKKVPAMSKLLADGIPADSGLTFLPMYPDEAAFLGSLLDEDHIIRLSYVATDGKDHVTYISGPLKSCVSGHSKIDSSEHLDKCRFGPSKEVPSSPSISEAALSEQLTPDSRNTANPPVSYRFRKRYAVIRVLLSGEEKEIRLGIILNDDIRRELSYGKVEAPMKMPEKYRVPEMARTGVACPDGNTGLDNRAFLVGAAGTARTGNEKSLPVGTGFSQKESPQGSLQDTSEDTIRCLPEFVPGDAVTVSEGSLAGLPAVVCRVGKQKARIKVYLFGRNLEMEVPLSSLKKV